MPTKFWKYIGAITKVWRANPAAFTASSTRALSMAQDIDVEQMRAACSALRARRVSRLLTQIYDRALEPVGLTVNQFGVLAHLDGQDHVSIGGLAELVGKHASTLNRDLKPLAARGFITSAIEPTDRRVRAIQLTPKGKAKLQRAIPFWHRAQVHVQEALGAEETVTLNDLLDLTAAKLTT